MTKSIQIVSLASGEPTGKELVLYYSEQQDYYEANPFEIDKYAEAKDQLLEGTEYEYELDTGLSLEKHSAVYASKKSANQGLIRIGNLVGALSIKVLNGADVIGVVNFEIRSKKIDYRSEYRKMLEDIAEQAAELAMSIAEQTFQKFEVDPSSSTKTRYEQFAFVRSLIDSDSFQSAIAKICTSPLTEMRNVMEERKVDSLRRIGRDALRQFVSRGNGVELPLDHALREYGISSLPRYVEICSREETVDTLENRFVKYVLETFLYFCVDIAAVSKDDSRLEHEAKSVANRLEVLLTDPLFRSVSRLDRNAISSPKLQRREGYREVLRSWIMFTMAAKISWSGGEDVYGAGNKNIAALYEYWAFFEVLKIFESVFKVADSEKRKLLKLDSRGLELTLMRGKTKVLEGSYDAVGTRRSLKAKLCYNKTFSAKEGLDVEGSWTVDMRPDYTISIWPSLLSEVEAEKTDSIVHIHLDAKYRIDKFKDIFSTYSNEVHEEEDRGTFKRGDLLKMHAYNDAIRRTYGSYILYPGDRDSKIRRYREIIPGVGAFRLRPVTNSNIAYGSVDLRVFLLRIVNSLQDRLTQRERIANYSRYVHAAKELQLPKEARKLKLPEYNNPMLRPFIPADESVIVGYYKNQAHLDWVLKNGYNFRIGDVNGSLHINPGVMSAEYVLLHGPGELRNTDKLYKIVVGESRMVWTKADLQALQYPQNPNHEYYMRFKLVPINPGEPLYGGSYDISVLNKYRELAVKKGRNKAEGYPFDVTFYELLMNAVVSVI